jgi:RNA polymerase-binding transcription factor DksA
MKRIEELLKSGGTLSELRPLLLEYFQKRLQEHLEDLEYERQEFSDVQGRNSDVNDQGSHLETLEGLTGRMDGQIAKIRMIRKVIRRIEHESRWHECCKCGMTILPRLLGGRPTTLCIDCKEEEEQTRIRTRTTGTLRYGYAALVVE